MKRKTKTQVYAKPGQMAGLEDAVWELRKQVQQLAKGVDQLVAAQSQLDLQMSASIAEIRATHAKLLRLVPKAVAALTTDALAREQFHQDHQR